MYITGKPFGGEAWLFGGKFPFPLPPSPSRTPAPPTAALSTIASPQNFESTLMDSEVSVAVELQLNYNDCVIKVLVVNISAHESAKCTICIEIDLDFVF